MEPTSDPAVESAPPVDTAPAPDPGPPAPNAGTPAVDESVLAALIAELDPDGTGLQNELVGSYLDAGGTEFQALQAAVVRVDLPTVAAMAHTLKSTSAVLGATRLAALLRAMEAAAKSGQPPLAALGREVDAEHRRVVETLSRLRDCEPAPPA